jgi:hypothetical protein
MRSMGHYAGPGETMARTFLPAGNICPNAMMGLFFCRFHRRSFLVKQNVNGNRVIINPNNNGVSPILIESKTGVSRFTKNSMNAKIAKLARYINFRFRSDNIFRYAKNEKTRVRAKDRNPMLIINPSLLPELCNEFE